MNNGIKNKLKELMGKDVGLNLEGNSSRIFITYSDPRHVYTEYKVLRIEDDCVVLSDKRKEIFQSIDQITQVIIHKE
jgi:hypothetical protein